MPSNTQHRETLARALAAVVLIWVGGCAATTEDETWSGYAEPPRPRAELATLRHVVAFAAGSARLTPPQRQQLEAFLASSEPETAEAVTVSVGEAGAGPGALRAPDALDALRLQEVAAVLRQRSPRAHVIQTAGVDLPPDAVALGVRRYVVALPPCPDWTGNPTRNYSNRTSSNWGCATAVNLGIMIANPRDLIRGEGPGPADGERLARSIERYRNDRTRPLLGEITSEIAPAASADAGD